MVGNVFVLFKKMLASYKEIQTISKESGYLIAPLTVPLAPLSPLYWIGSTNTDDPSSDIS